MRLRVTELLASTSSVPSAQTLPDLPDHCQDLLCLYPSSLSHCGIAAGLHFAFQCIRQDSGPALVLCPPHALEDCQLLPLPVGAQGADELLAHIHLKYISGATALRHFIAAMHLLPQAPGAIVVMGLSRLLGLSGRQPQGRGQEMQLVHIMGLLLEGVQTLRKMSGQNIPLLVMDEATDTAHSPRLFILERWLPTCFKIQPTGAGKGAMSSNTGCCTFTLSLLGKQPTLCAVLKQVVLHYTMHASHIELNAVTFDNELGHPPQDLGYTGRTGADAWMQH